jgi:bifunctional pyridoxal-dependent enzyme with beta-cystathionase and maltose regulon repressor activities
MAPLSILDQHQNEPLAVAAAVKIAHIEAIAAGAPQQRKALSVEFLKLTDWMRRHQQYCPRTRKIDCISRIATHFALFIHDLTKASDYNP